MEKTIISNTSPLRYLTCIDEQDLLPQLFTKILIPKAVYLELIHPNAPLIVQQYFHNLPTWIEVCEITSLKDNNAIYGLDAGETEAILLMLQKQADLLLIDDKKGRLTAEEHNLTIMGTLGILELASRQHKICLPQTINKLLQTNIKISPVLIEYILKRQ